MLACDLMCKVHFLSSIDDISGQLLQVFASDSGLSGS